jgi:MraZ protein
MSSFKGTFQYTIDSKDRLNIPSKFRKLLPSEDNKTFVVCRGSDGCLDVFPQHEWELREAQMRALAWTKKDNRKVLRALLLNAAESQYDAQGRIAIPPQLQKLANLEKDVMIIGMLDHIELWNPDIYEQYNKIADTEPYEVLLERIALP